MKKMNNWQIGALKRKVIEKDKKIITLTLEGKYLKRTNNILKEKIRLYEKSNNKIKRNFAHLNLRKKRNI